MYVYNIVHNNVCTYTLYKVNTPCTREEKKTNMAYKERLLQTYDTVVIY